MSRVFAYRVQGFRAICDGIVKVQGLAAHFNPEKHETHQHSQAHTCAFDQKQRRAMHMFDSSRNAHPLCLRNSGRKMKADKTQLSVTILSSASKQTLEWSLSIYLSIHLSIDVSLYLAI